MENTAVDRRISEVLLAGDARTIELDDLPVAPNSIIDGTPTAGVRELSGLPGSTVGIWEMTPGTVTETEVDEVFVVLAGRGTVVFSDDTTVPLGPGSVVRLRAGDRTTWTVIETLRQVYISL